MRSCKVAISTALFIVIISSLACKKHSLEDNQYEPTSIMPSKILLKNLGNSKFSSLINVIDTIKIVLFTQHGAEYGIAQIKTERFEFVNKTYGYRCIALKLVNTKPIDFEILEVFTNVEVPKNTRINFLTNILMKINNRGISLPTLSQNFSAILYNRLYSKTTAFSGNSEDIHPSNLQIDNRSTGNLKTKIRPRSGGV